MNAVGLSPSLPRRTCCCSQVTVCQGRGIMRVSRGPKTLALNPYPLQETQASLGTPSQMGPWRSGVAAASAQVCPYQAQQHSWKINPQQLAESSHGFPDCRGRAVMGGKAKGKPLEQPLLRKTAHQPASLVGLQSSVPPPRT